MEELRNYKVYAHIRKEPDENGVYKRYIGITGVNLNERWKNGKGYKRKNIDGHYSYFYKSIQKYGWNSFTHIVLLQNLTKEEALYWEKKLIKIYESNNKKYGYNSDEGGIAGSIPNKAVREKMSKNHADVSGSKNPMYGKSGELAPFFGRTGEKHHASKKVLCVETGIIYNSLREAERITGIHNTNISACCLGKYRHKTAGGYHWKHIDK